MSLDVSNYGSKTTTVFIFSSFPIRYQEDALQAAKEWGLDEEDLERLRDAPWDARYDSVKMTNDTTLRWQVDAYGRKTVITTKQKSGRDLLQEDLENYKRLKAENPGRKVTMKEVQELNKK